ncbi:DHH family phosphoesterase [Atopococcus tabaci]|uniref:DHH family phosphoesterase n=1 Tax=Atopococcus tabaci TaxID=269774 RepID=UPI000408D379|nr:bifunctional oligoribonuclease/PAP phosphatase NrnA [Atopococcus tabaci]
MKPSEKVTQAQREILDAVRTYDTIIIHRHIRPDPDAIGSQVGLAELLKNSFPAKRIYSVGSLPDNLSFLAEMNHAEPSDYHNALVIVTDTANEGRIDDNRYRLGQRLIKIDHHPGEDAYAETEWVDPSASSCSEMIANFWLAFPEELKMNAQAARLLYAGIVGDTNRFLYDATSPDTMRTAASLMEQGFSHTEVNHQLTQINSKVAKLTGYVLENLEIRPSGAAQIVLTQETLSRFGLTDADTHSVVPLPGTIEGVTLWGIFVEQEDGVFRCRLRSKGPVINGLAARHDGGGHPLASGANAKDLAEIHQIIAEMDELGANWQERSTQ